MKRLKSQVQAEIIFCDLTKHLWNLLFTQALCYCQDCYTDPDVYYLHLFIIYLTTESVIILLKFKKLAFWIKYTN